MDTKCINKTNCNYVIVHGCDGKINKLISFEKEEAIFMFFNDDIKAAHPFYKDNINNFTYCRAYAVHGNIKRF